MQSAITKKQVLYISSVGFIFGEVQYDKELYCVDGVWYMNSFTYPYQDICVFEWYSLTVDNKQLQKALTDKNITFEFEEQRHETFKLLYGKAKEYEATLALVKGENRPNILRSRPDFQNEKRCYDVDKVELLSPDRGHNVTDVFSLYFSALYTAYAY